MVECLNRELFLCIFVDGFHEWGVRELDWWDGEWLCWTCSFGLLEESLDFSGDCCPAILLDCGVAHVEVLMLKSNERSRWMSWYEGEQGKIRGQHSYAIYLSNSDRDLWYYHIPRCSCSAIKNHTSCLPPTICLCATEGDGDSGGVCFSAQRGHATSFYTTAWLSTPGGKRWGLD